MIIEDNSVSIKTMKSKKIKQKKIKSRNSKVTSDQNKKAERHFVWTCNERTGTSHHNWNSGQNAKQRMTEMLDSLASWLSEGKVTFIISPTKGCGTCNNMITNAVGQGT